MTATSQRGTPPRGKLRLAVLRAPSAPSTNANETVLRATGILMFLAIGAIHFLQIVPTTENTPLLGVAFLFLIAGSLIVAMGLMQRGDRSIWAAGAGVCVAAMGGYAFTRTFSTPIDNQDVGNWSCMLGMAALFVETTLLALSLHAARGQRALQTAVNRLPEVRPRRVTPRDPNAA